MGTHYWILFLFNGMAKAFFSCSLEVTAYQCQTKEEQKAFLILFLITEA
jgi:hypothetical protein